MTTQKPDVLVGTTLGSFKVTKILGRGGMGTVYLGEHAVIGSRVAIKVLQERLASDEGLVARFYAEARAVNLIGHDNIVNIFDMNVVPPNRYYLVMEYLEGTPLNALLTAAVPAPTAIPILLQVCDALQAAHDAGIVHRDLKPENIFLIKRGRTEHFVKVLDFGLAKLLDGDRGQPADTAAGLIVGTPEFMSPEQANSAPVDARSDLYSLGCIAWLLATGRLPFPQRGLTDLLVAHRSQTPRAPHEVVPTVPRALSDAIMRAMSKRPEERFQSATEFAAALEAALRSLSLPAPTMSPPAVSPVRASAPAHAPAPPAAPPPAPVAPAIPAVAPVVPQIPPVTGVAGPARPAPRHSAKFGAVVTLLDGQPLGTLACNDISKGGMFLSTTGQMPPVFTRIKITIPSAGNMDLLGEVVRHVPPDQASAWGMAPGFGVQFIDLTPALREDVQRLIQGLPVQPRTTSPSGHVRSMDSTLTLYRDRMNGDHYEMLALPPTAGLEEIRTRGQAAQDELATLKNKTLDPGRVAQLDAALTRVRAAFETLGAPVARARYDANRGNFAGVARCLVAGLGPLDLERLRQEYLAEHPTAAGSAHVKFLASKALEQSNQLKDALVACEHALQIDPLNLQLHQRHALLARKLKDAPKA